MYHLFLVERYPQGLPSAADVPMSPEERAAMRKAECQECWAWAQENPIARRLFKVAKKEGREAGFNHPSWNDEPLPLSHPPSNPSYSLPASLLIRRT
jgi:hypothetical protein